MTVTYDLTGKTTFVTDGSAGMGVATIRAFAEAGANVNIVDFDGNAAERLAAQLNDEGNRAIGIACDVSDEDQVAVADPCDSRDVRQPGHGVQQRWDHAAPGRFGR